MPKRKPLREIESRAMRDSKQSPDWGEKNENNLLLDRAKRAAEIDTEMGRAAAASQSLKRIARHSVLHHKRKFFKLPYFPMTPQP